MALVDIQNYLIRRKDLKPTPSIFLESIYLQDQDTFIYRAEIQDKFNGDWEDSIQGAFDSLENFLRSIGEIV